MISEGQRGDCRVRENRGGTLYTMTYGNPCTYHVDPIEKKPLFHFLPASLAFSLSTAGCNLHCLYCQNWEISQSTPEELIAQLRLRGVEAGVVEPVLPEQLVSYAEQTNSASIAFTYGEPTVFYEYMYDTAAAGQSRGMRSVVISAGYINQEPLRQLCAVVDAIKIDLKGINETFYREICFATLKPVLETIRTIAQSGTHLEIVNLVVPRYNDDPADMRKLARWVVDEVGPDVPLHFSRFHPTYKLTSLPPTPLASLEQAREIAMEQGLRFVYIGNVPGHEASHTYCPACGEIVIRRSGFSVLEIKLEDGRCALCGEVIPGVWE
jgi:pyruvate formate lyase activating enzyme